ncbi:hypothetical protein O6H91_21G061200 [Diphasiastrum complanatum]|uniref:Uncharacterized protein n=1 Tax=Diphasiastrum complanatum TaxID=34168 RepID=A0ACC2AKZ4_DIPCM|nr:hypothetical protein O6H91_21G061200 [Diphasiastrum complanatum]
MWRLKQFLPKDHSSLQGKTVEIGTLKLQIRSIIAQGGFSSVYFAKDSQTGKHYALKHIICNDVESLDLAKKEIAVMKSLRGHPNVVMLHANVILDTGRAKECFIAMDHCEKTLVNVLDGRETCYFDEKHLLITFRDICNAVYALHRQSPVISHRDLKAENILLGPDGAWKLCDFGSTSTNHKRFDKPEEMGIEEDVIRKHTTPAYRAPEMWDLYRRELICEKVDIWALGCLLYHMAYLKLAFDGDSKLQILNGNYHIPDSPNYSPNITNLIKDMLKSSPEIWHCVNNLLPSDERKSAPDKSPLLVKSELSLHNDAFNAGSLGSHPITSKRNTDLKSAEHYSSQNGDSGRWAGSFWSSSFAQETQLEGSSLSDSKKMKNSTSTRSSSPRAEIRSLTSEQTGICHDLGKNGASPVAKGFDGASESLSSSWSKTSADYLDLSPITPAISNLKTSEHVQDEIDGLKTALEEALKEKTEMLAKFKKLSALCRSQRQEIQDLKSSLAAISNRNILSTTKDPHEAPSTSPAQFMQHMNAQQKQLQAERWHVFDEESDTQKRPITDLQGLSPRLLPRSPASTAHTWQAFDNSELRLSSGHMARFPDQSVVSSGDLEARSIEGRHARHQHVRSASVGGKDWDFGRGRFMANSKVSQDSPKLENKVSLRDANTSRNGTAAVRRFSSNSQQPAGWAAF